MPKPKYTRCPTCRSFMEYKPGSPELDGLAPAYGCSNCEIIYAVGFADNVGIILHGDPRVRLYESESDSDGYDLI